MLEDICRDLNETQSYSTVSQFTLTPLQTMLNIQLKFLYIILLTKNLFAKSERFHTVLLHIDTAANNGV